jgi:hypothetical protein
MSGFENFIKIKKRKLSTISTVDMEQELLSRQQSINPFPLDVFNDRIKPFIQCLVTNYDLPESFIGLSLLSAYSTAIGNAYWVTTNGVDHFPLQVWGALVGISSSGKSIALSKILKPLIEIQEEFDKQWEIKKADLGPDRIEKLCIDTVVYRDSHIPTLTKSVLPDNPKGLLKLCDELIEWINGLNQLSKKEGTDEQFWLSSWNGTSYSAIRSGKNKFAIQKPFVNVIGGLQYSALKKLFGFDRDTTGFAYRLLFARPTVRKIAQPDPSYVMPKEFQKLHDDSITLLFNDLPYNSGNQPKICRMSEASVKLFEQWAKEKTIAINNEQDFKEQEFQAGIFGKVKEYACRFSALLHLADCALNGGKDSFLFKNEEIIGAETMNKALRLADYFFVSAVETTQEVQKSLVAPPDVLVAASMFRRGSSYSDIGEYLFGERNEKFKVRARRAIAKWSREYPKVFHANA